MARSLKKGPFADAHLTEKSRCYERSWTKQAVIKTCVASFYNLPADGWTYNR